MEAWIRIERDLKVIDLHLTIYYYYESDKRKGERKAEI